MTQKELKEFVLKLIKTCNEKKCYIKGYGDKFRVMDHTHSPVINITKEVMSVLKHNKIFSLKGAVYVLEEHKTFTHYLEIELP